MTGILFLSPLGTIAVVEDGGAIVRLDFDETLPEGCPAADTALLNLAREQLTAYFEGRLKYFGLPLRMNGTPFQLRVWQALQTIPYGETRTYGQIAVTAGNPSASRAVGMANHNNPLSLVVPCHRVIGANGRMVGYGGGIWRKEALLQLERDNLAKA